jgi:SAM-dependent methyltransferase
MVTLPSPTPPADDAAHRHPEIAQAFGADAEKYDRARPRYPAALIDAITERLSGRAILDVGIGTGISAESFRDRGFAVLGVEPDPKMAALAHAKGFAVESGRFEDWDPAGRTFDGVIAGQTWHWIDPIAGAAKAVSALHPGGRLAVFWNSGLPSPELAAEFAKVFASLDTGLPSIPGPPRRTPTPTARSSTKPPTGFARRAHSAE